LDASFQAEDLLSAYGKRLRLYESPRQAGLPEELTDIDLAVLNGEPNWFTTFHQLKALEQRSVENGNAFPVVLIHNVRWPYGRRDMYPDPERIPDEFRQPYERRGLVPGSSKLVSDGMFADRCHAVAEHGPRNGVRTAVDDFIADSYRRWRFVDLPGLSGIGILVSSDRLEAQPELVELLERFSSSEFLTGHLTQLELVRVNADAARQRTTAEAEQLGERSQRLESELLMRTGEHEKLRHQHQGLHNRVLELERAHRDSQTEHQRLAQDLAKLENDLRLLLSERDNLIEQFKSSRAQLGTREAALQQARESARESEAALRRVERDLDEAVGERDAALSRAEMLEDDFRDSQRAVAALQRELERTRIRLETELSASNRRIMALEEERERLRSAHDAQQGLSQQRIADMEQAVASLRGQLETAQLERDQLRQRLLAAEEALAYERQVHADALVLARRIYESRSWRFGHRLFTVLRVLTFRRTRGTSAAQRLVHRLEAPALIEPASGTPGSPPKQAARPTI
jgi:hypothetical protein